MLTQPILLSLSLACGQVAQEAEEVIEADSLEQAADEAGDVIDEIGDAVNPNDKVQIEPELDRMADELKDGVEDVKSKLDPEGD